MKILFFLHVYILPDSVIGCSSCLLQVFSMLYNALNCVAINTHLYHSSNITCIHHPSKFGIFVFNPYNSIWSTLKCTLCSEQTTGQLQYTYKQTNYTLLMWQLQYSDKTDLITRFSCTVRPVFQAGTPWKKSGRKIAVREKSGNFFRCWLLWKFAVQFNSCRWTRKFVKIWTCTWCLCNKLTFYCFRC